ELELLLACAPPSPRSAMVQPPALFREQHRVQRLVDAGKYRIAVLPEDLSHHLVDDGHNLLGGIAVAYHGPACNSGLSLRLRSGNRYRFGREFVIRNLMLLLQHDGFGNERLRLRHRVGGKRLVPQLADALDDLLSLLLHATTTSVHSCL